MDYYKLIETVKQKPELWGVSQQYFENSGNLWIEVAEKIGATAQTCFKEWSKLRFLYKYYADQIKTNSWEYYEQLKFLNVTFAANNPNSNIDFSKDKHERDKLDLIAKVKERPYLWKLPQRKRNYLKAATLWKEIADLVGFSEKICIEYWHDLNSKYIYHKGKENKLLGTSNKYNCQWKYYEHLKFLDDVNDPQIKAQKYDTFKIDQFELITKVKERPYLWRTECSQKDKDILKYFWSEVSECIGFRVDSCKKQWNELLSLYTKEKERNELLKQNGVGDETEEWVYFEHMKFLDIDNAYSTDAERNNRVSKKFNDDESIIRLIAEVKKRPPLWKHRRYGSKKMNAFFWSEVAKKLNTKEKHCKGKWNKLKGLYKMNYIMRRENVTIKEKFLYYDHLQFLNESIGEKIKNNSTVQNRNDIVGVNDKSINPEQHALLNNNKKQHLDILWVEHWPQLQNSSLTNIQLEKTEYTCIEVDSSESSQDECSSSISGMILNDYENVNSPQLIGKIQSPTQHTKQQIAQFEYEEAGCVKEELNVSDIYIKEESGIQPYDQAANRLHSYVQESREIHEKDDSEVNWDAIYKDCLEFESFVSNWGENTEGTDDKLIKHEASNEEESPCAIQELHLPSSDNLINENKFASVDITSCLSKGIQNGADSDTESVTAHIEENAISYVVEQLIDRSESELVSESTRNAQCDKQFISVDITSCESKCIKNEADSGIGSVTDSAYKEENAISYAVEQLSDRSESELVSESTRSAQCDKLIKHEASNEEESPCAIQELNLPSSENLINENKFASVDITSCLSKRLKNGADSDTESVTAHKEENAISYVVEQLVDRSESELVSESTRNAQFDKQFENSIKDCRENNAELSSCRKRSHNITIVSKGSKNKKSWF